MQHAFLYNNGTFELADEVGVSPFDLGLLRSNAIFEFFRTIQGKPLFLNDHIHRFFQSAAILHLPVPVSQEELTDIYSNLISLNSLDQSGIRTVLTAGVSEDGYTPSVPTLLVMSHDLPVYDQKLYTKGGLLLPCEYRRDIPNVKTTNYAFASSRSGEMKTLGACELLYSFGGTISECARSNIFFVDQEGCLVTPSKGVLAGVTRKHVIEVASSLVAVIEREIEVKELTAFREAFITSTTKGIMPIREIYGHAVYTGTPGTITRDIMQQFDLLLEEYDYDKKAG